MNFEAKNTLKKITIIISNTMLISLDQIQPVINQLPSACQDFSYKIVIFRVFYCFFLLYNHVQTKFQK